MAENNLRIKINDCRIGPGHGLFSIASWPLWWFGTEGRNKYFSWSKEYFWGNSSSSEIHINNHSCLIKRQAEKTQFRTLQAMFIFLHHFIYWSLKYTHYWGLKACGIGKYEKRSHTFIPMVPFFSVIWSN